MKKKVTIEIELDEVVKILTDHIEKTEGLSNLELLKIGDEGVVFYTTDTTTPSCPPKLLKEQPFVAHKTRPNWGVGNCIKAIFKDYKEYEIHDVFNLLKDDFPNLTLDLLRLYVKRKDMVGYPIIEVTNNRYKRRSNS